MKRKIAPFSLTLLFVLSLLLLAGGPVASVHAGRSLPVNIRNGGAVDNEIVNVSKSAGDLVWYSEGDDFSVKFSTSPFSTSTFHVPARGNVSSGPVRSNAGLGQYSYFVTDNTIGHSADPSLNVTP